MQESTRGAIMGGLGKGRKGAKPSAVHVRRAASGGYIVRHEGGGTAKDSGPGGEEHVVPDMAALQQHLQGALGDGEGDEGGGIPPTAGGQGD